MIQTRTELHAIIHDIAAWITKVGKPVSRPEICKQFGFTFEEWRVIRDQIRYYPTELPIKTYGNKRGKRYYVEGIDFVTDRELAEQMYQVLYNSENELRWSEIVERADLFQKNNLSPQVIRSRSPNIQRILKESHPDFVTGNSKNRWAIKNHHDVRTFPKYCANCGMKLKNKPNYCSNCGCKI